MQQDLLDLVGCDPDANRRTDVHRELLLSPEGDQDGERDAAASPTLEPRPRPDLTPRVARDEILEVGGERRRPLDRTVDVLVAEDLASDLRAPLELLAHVASVPAGTRTYSRSADVKAPGCSRFARWAHSGKTVSSAARMDAARNAPSSGGVATSSSPERTSVGVRIALTSERASQCASASQHAA